MRASERARVERYASRVLEKVAPKMRLLVGWSRECGSWHEGVHGEAFIWAVYGVIMLSEKLFESGTPESREDTIRHELAHLVAWHRHGHEIPAHGREWRAARADIDAALEADE
jgi:hypothetical protein